MSKAVFYGMSLGSRIVDGRVTFGVGSRASLTLDDGTAIGGRVVSSTALSSGIDVETDDGRLFNVDGATGWTIEIIESLADKWR